MGEEGGETRRELAARFEALGVCRRAHRPGGYGLLIFIFLLLNTTPPHLPCTATLKTTLVQRGSNDPLPWPDNDNDSGEGTVRMGGAARARRKETQVRTTLNLVFAPLIAPITHQRRPSWMALAPPPRTTISPPWTTLHPSACHLGIPLVDVRTADPLQYSPATDDTSSRATLPPYQRRLSVTLLSQTTAPGFACGQLTNGRSLSQTTLSRHPALLLWTPLPRRYP